MMRTELCRVGCHAALTASLVAAVSALSCSGADEIDGPRINTSNPMLAEPRIGITPVPGDVPDSLIPGVRATAGTEDLVLTGDYGRYIVERNVDDDEQRPPRAGDTTIPGALIDAQGDGGGLDEMVAVTTTIQANEGIPEPIWFSEVRISEESLGGAIVAKRFFKIGRAELEIEQRVVLSRELPHLVLITNVRNISDTRVVIRLGDRLQFGAGLVHGGPSGPTTTAGQKRVPWLGFESTGQAYGYTFNGKTPFTSEFYVSERGNKPLTLAVDAQVEPRNLGRNEEATFVRRFIASSDGLPGVRAWIDQLHQRSVGRLRGKIQSKRRLNPDQFRLELWKGNTYVGLVPLKSSLAFDVRAPIANYQLRVRGPWGMAPKPQNVNVTGSSGSVDFKFPDLGEVELSVYDRKSNRPLPASVIVTDLQGNPVSLGPGNTAIQAGPATHLYTGNGTIFLPAGRYRLTATRGPEYDLVTEEVDIRPGSPPVQFVARLTRVMSTRGWVRADLRVYTDNGLLGTTPPEDVMAASVSQGVEFVVTRDRPPTSVRDALNRASLTGFTTGAAGLEPSTIAPYVGVFGILPNDVATTHQNMALAGLAPRPLLANLVKASTVDPFVWLAWGRTATSTGYFDKYRFDEASGKLAGTGGTLDFEGIELYSGEGLGESGTSREFGTLLTTWKNFLSRDKTFTAVAASGSRDIAEQPVGVPFTWVDIGDKNDGTPSEIEGSRVVAGLRGARAVPSTGPLIEFTIDGKPPGTTLPGKFKVKIVKGERRIIWLNHDIRIKVTSPKWLRFDRVELYRNGVLFESWDNPTAARKGVQIFEEKVAERMPRDGWWFVRVTGQTPIPIYPQRRVTPWAMSNWIRVDANRDGKVIVKDGGGAPGKKEDTHDPTPGATDSGHE